MHDIVVIFFFNIGTNVKFSSNVEEEDCDNVMHVNQLNVEYRHNSLSKVDGRKAAQCQEWMEDWGMSPDGARKTIRCSGGAPFTTTNTTPRSLLLPFLPVDNRSGLSFKERSLHHVVIVIVIIGLVSSSSWQRW